MALPGIGTFLGGIGALIAKLPIQGRKERWKNELDKLENERKQILSEEWNEKKNNRLTVVLNRIDELNRLLRNSSDAG
jgi:hypothetical protein